ncbi:unnamed protein product, partial [Symbiodinium sp. KB8]
MAAPHPISVPSSQSSEEKKQEHPGLARQRSGSWILGTPAEQLEVGIGADEVELDRDMAENMAGHKTDTKKVSECFQSKKSFSLLTRKHQCRCCGLYFVSDCANKNFIIPGLPNEGPQRVCLHCYEHLNNNNLLIPRKLTAILVLECGYLDHPPSPSPDDKGPTWTVSDYSTRLSLSLFGLRKLVETGSVADVVNDWQKWKGTKTILDSIVTALKSKAATSMLRAQAALFVNALLDVTEGLVPHQAKQLQLRKTVVDSGIVAALVTLLQSSSVPTSGRIAAAEFISKMCDEAGVTSSTEFVMAVQDTLASSGGAAILSESLSNVPEGDAGLRLQAAMTRTMFGFMNKRPTLYKRVRDEGGISYILSVLGGLDVATAITPAGRNRMALFLTVVDILGRTFEASEAYVDSGENKGLSEESTEMRAAAMELTALCIKCNGLDALFAMLPAPVTALRTDRGLTGESIGLGTSGYSMQSEIVATSKELLLSTLFVLSNLADQGRSMLTEGGAGFPSSHFGDLHSYFAQFQSSLLTPENLAMIVDALEVLWIDAEMDGKNEGLCGVLCLLRLLHNFLLGSEAAAPTLCKYGLPELLANFLTGQRLASATGLAEGDDTATVLYRNIVGYAAKAWHTIMKLGRKRNPVQDRQQGTMPNRAKVAIAAARGELLHHSDLSECYDYDYSSFAAISAVGGSSPDTLVPLMALSLRMLHPSSSLPTCLGRLVEGQSTVREPRHFRLSDEQTPSSIALDVEQAWEAAASVLFGCVLKHKHAAKALTGLAVDFRPRDRSGNLICQSSNERLKEYLAVRVLHSLLGTFGEHQQLMEPILGVLHSLCCEPSARKDLLALTQVSDEMGSFSAATLITKGLREFVMQENPVPAPNSPSLKRDTFMGNRAIAIALVTTLSGFSHDFISSRKDEFYRKCQNGSGEGKEGEEPLDVGQ